MEINENAMYKIETLLEAEKIRDINLSNAIKDNYHGNTVANIGSSALGSILTSGLSVPAAGLYQGMQNSHPIAGLLNGSAGSLGAASNNIEGITLKDAFNKANVAGNLGVLSPLITPIQYGLGKAFGNRGKSANKYNRNLNLFKNTDQ